MVAVNSRDRNYAAYPNAANFRWRFRRPFKDVLSIQLINGSIPSDLYNVNVGWNKFTFQEGATNYTITLTPGQYTVGDFAIELASQLNAIPAGVNTYATFVSPVTKKLVITRTVGAASFGHLFQSGVYVDQLDTFSGAIQEIKCPARLMGFERQDYKSDAAGVLAAPNRMDVDSLTNRVYLHINADNTQELNRIEFGAGRHDCFQILYLDSTANAYYSLNKETDVATFTIRAGPDCAPHDAGYQSPRRVLPRD